MQCTSCHADNGSGMSGRHTRHIINEGMRCSECHEDVINANEDIIAPNLHINGVHEIKMNEGTWNAGTNTCENIGCHRNFTW